MARQPQRSIQNKADPVTNKETLFAYVTITKVDDAFLAGVTLSERTSTDEGKPYYEPVKVLSLYIDNPDIDSINKAIKYVITQTIWESVGARLLIVRGVQSAFYRGWKFVRQLTPIANGYGMKLEVSHIDRTNKTFSECYALGQDALNRKGSVVAKI